MDSETILKSDKIYLNQIVWEKSSENEWKSSNQLPNERNVTEILRKFKDSRFYLVIDNVDASEIEKPKLVNLIKTLYGEKDFRIWTRNFRFVIEFNKTKIYREGTIKENNVEYFFARLIKFILN
jgi:hypothetical protein